MTLKRKPQSYDPQSQHTSTQILRIYVENDKDDLNITWQEIRRMVSTRTKAIAQPVVCLTPRFLSQKHTKQQQQKASRHTPLISALWRWV